MNVPAKPAPIPKDPRHQRFADRFLAGDSLTDAYLAAGFKVSREVARKNARRMRKRDDVNAYIRHLQLAAADESVLLVLEKRQFLARIVRTPLMSIDPNDPNFKDGDLILKYKHTETETGSHWEIAKLDPLKAIAEDNRLSGDDPEANAMQQMAEALQAIGRQTQTLPEDKM